MIVIDASVATKLINTKEEGSGKALGLLKKHIEGDEDILVPPLLFLEVANALATKSHMSQPEITRGIDFLYNATFLVHEVTKENIQDAASLAKQYKTSVYDMLYAVIAKERKCVLLTADTKFVSKTKFPFVKPLL